MKILLQYKINCLKSASKQYFIYYLRSQYSWLSAINFTEIYTLWYRESLVGFIYILDSSSKSRLFTFSHSWI